MGIQQGALPAAGMLLWGLFHGVMLCAVLLPCTNSFNNNASVAPGPVEYMAKELQGSNEKIVGPLKYIVPDNTMVLHTCIVSLHAYRNYFHRKS